MLFLQISIFSDYTFPKAVLTCPAWVAPAVATHWVTAIGVATVTALSTLQPIGAILTTILKNHLLSFYNLTHRHNQMH